MKRAAVALLLVLSDCAVRAQGPRMAPPDAQPPASQVITGTGLDIRTPTGFLQFGGNELTVGSTVEDPPKVRLTTPAGKALGSVSFNRTRPDGVQEEIVLITGTEAEDAPGSMGGQFQIAVRRKLSDGDQAMRLAVVVTVAYSRTGEPEIYIAPAMGVFTQRPYMAPLGAAR